MTDGQVVLKCTIVFPCIIDSKQNGKKVELYVVMSEKHRTMYKKMKLNYYYYIIIITMVWIFSISDFVDRKSTVNDFYKNYGLNFSVSVIL